MAEPAGADLGEQLLLQLAVGVGSRGEADRGPLAHRVHQRAGLVGRHPPVADQLPFQPLAHDRDQLLDELVGQLGAPDHAARGSARCRGSPRRRAAGCSATGWRRHCRPARATTSRVRRCRPVPRTPAPRAARGRPRPARTAWRWCGRPGPDPRRSAPGCARGSGRRPRSRRRRAAAPPAAAAWALAATVARQRLPDLRRQVADQQLQHGVGQRPAAAAAELVELAAELGRHLRARLRRAVALQTCDVRRRSAAARAPCRRAGAAAPRACRPPSRHRRAPAHPVPNRTAPPARAPGHGRRDSLAT